MADTMKLLIGMGKPPYAVHVVGGRVQFGRAQEDDAARRKGWGAPVATEVRNTTFEAAIPLSTVADLFRALAAVESDARVPLLGVRLDGARRDGWRAFLVAGLDRESGRERFWRVVSEAGLWTVEASQESFSVFRRGGLDGVLDLREVARRSGLAPDAELNELKYASGPWEPERVAVQIEPGWPGVWVDAATGAHLSMPR